MKNERKRNNELMETKQVVFDYLTNNFILFPSYLETKMNLDNYLRLIETKYDKFKRIMLGKKINKFSSPKIIY